MTYPDHIAKLAQAAVADKRTRQGGWGAIADALMTLDKRNVALVEALLEMHDQFSHYCEYGEQDEKEMAALIKCRALLT